MRSTTKVDTTLLQDALNIGISKVLCKGYVEEINQNCPSVHNRKSGPEKPHSILKNNSFPETFDTIIDCGYIWPSSMVQGLRLAHCFL